MPAKVCALLDQLINTRLDIHNSDVPVLCRSCEARHMGICGALSSAQLIALSKHTTKHTLAAEQQIAFEGDTTKRFSNIIYGVVKLSRLTADGRQQIVGLQFPPDFIGRPFSKENTVTVEAATNVGLCSFPSHILEKLTSEAPDLQHRLHEQSLKELNQAREWMLALGQKSAAERVASFIYFIALNINPESAQNSNQREFEIPLKRADIADFLGLTIETVSRQLTKLRQAGVLKIDNRMIEVRDLARLKSLTEIDQLGL